MNDFNENHLANQSINDILLVKYSPIENVYYLDDFIENDTLNIQSESLTLSLERKPTLDTNFRVKIVVELSNNEVYEQLSDLFILE